MKRHSVLDAYQKISGTLAGTNSRSAFEYKLTPIISALETSKNDINTATLLNQLYNLILIEAGEPELIESCRIELSQLIQSPHINNTLDDIFHSALLLLNDLAPINNQDPISLERIPQRHRITLFNGNQFNISTLSRWLNTKGNFTNPLTGTFFAPRDQVRIRQRCAEQGRKLKPALLATEGNPILDDALNLNEIKTLIQSDSYCEESLTLLTHYIQINPKDQQQARLLRAFVFENQPIPDLFRALEDCIHVYHVDIFNKDAKLKIERLSTQLNISLANQAAFIKVIASGRAHIDEFLALDPVTQSEVLNNPNAVVNILNAAQIELEQFLSLTPAMRQCLYQFSPEVVLLLKQNVIAFEQLPIYLEQRQQEALTASNNTILPITSL